jgi:hypothetical protein
MPSPPRPVSGRGQGRKPPEAVAHSASLEAGRSPVYFQHSCSMGRDGEGARSDLGHVETGIFLQRGLDWWKQIESFQQIRRCAQLRVRFKLKIQQQ